MSKGTAVKLDQVTVRFGRRQALDRVSLDVAAGERVAVVGESGAGKTTLLNVIAGLVPASAGCVTLAGKDAGGLGPADRRVGILFQSDALFPHMSVFENVAFPLRARRWTNRDVQLRVEELLTQVGLQDRHEDLPGSLSGGQRQRVSLARALALSPAVLLLDEPFASLDSTLRRRLRKDVLSFQEQEHFTLIVVTHDPDEAAQIGERVAVLRDGRLVAFESGCALYWKPSSAYLGGLFGPYNLLPVERREVNGRAITYVLGREVPLPTVAANESINDQTKLLVRPESIRVSPTAETSSPDKSWIGTVTSVHDLGKAWGLRIALDDCGGVELEANVVDTSEEVPRPGMKVTCSLDWPRVALLYGEPNSTAT